MGFLCLDQGVPPGLRFGFVFLRLSGFPVRVVFPGLGFEACRIGSVFIRVGSGIPSVGIPGAGLVGLGRLRAGRGGRGCLGPGCTRAAGVVSGPDLRRVLGGYGIGGLACGVLAGHGFLLPGHLLFRDPLRGFALLLCPGVPVIPAAACRSQQDQRDDPSGGTAGALLLRILRRLCHLFAGFLGRFLGLQVQFFLNVGHGLADGSFGISSILIELLQFGLQVFLLQFSGLQLGNHGIDKLILLQFVFRQRSGCGEGIKGFIAHSGSRGRIHPFTNLLVFCGNDARRAAGCNRLIAAGGLFAVVRKTFLIL